MPLFQPLIHPKLITDIMTLENKEFLIIEIEDTGKGVDEELKLKIFEPYFSTKRGGTGLGLVIVKSIISDHNGFIRVRDNQPTGTTITIELPVKEKA